MILGMSAITQFLPKNHLSFLVGRLVHWRLPSFIATPLIMAFAKFYNINLEEAEKTVSEYPSIGEFFVRKLKPGLRPIASTWAVHPADSVITQADIIREGKLIQAKGKTYNVQDFTTLTEALNIFKEGQFLTYYLCPTDYHRVHSPVSGEITQVIHIPGALWPVNNWSTDNIEELFSINERVYVEIKTERGLVGVMFVGATNVGFIELAFDESISGNQLKVFKPITKKYSDLKIKKGDELGRFRMGSTVVMLYQKGCLENFEQAQTQFKGKAVRVNSQFC